MLRLDWELHFRSEPGAAKLVSERTAPFPAQGCQMAVSAEEATRRVAEIENVYLSISVPDQMPDPGEPS